MKEKEMYFIGTVDSNRLAIAIDRHMAKTGETDLYIFMNMDTFRALSEDIRNCCDPISPLQIYIKTLSPLGFYMGCKVFEDNTLEYGEIEIR